MITLAIIIAILILFALLRFGVSAEYSAEGFILKVQAGPLSIRVFPQKEKTEKAKIKAEERARKSKLRKAKKKEKAKKKTVEKKPGSLKDFFVILSAAKNMLSRVKRRLLIKKLTIYFTSAGDDPSKTALLYGAANAVFGSITPVLENNFRIKKRDFQAFADFLTQEQSIYLNAAISLAVWEAVYIVFALFPVIKVFAKRVATQKTSVVTDGKDGEKDGQAPNQ